MPSLTVPRSKELGREADPYWRAVQYGPRYIDEVRSIGEKAIHKVVKVGALAVASTTGGRVVIEKAVNQNLKPGTNETKWCAEGKIFQRVEDLGGKIHVLFVCGTQQPDTQSGIWTPTLHPCGECREDGADSSAVDEDTLVISVHPDKDEFEAYSFSELEVLHSMSGIQKPEFSHYIDPGFTKWTQNRAVFDTIIHSGPELSLLPSVTARLAITGQLSAASLGLAA